MVAVSTMGGGAEPSELASLGVELRDTQSDKLKFGIVKLLLDGSIQGFTARVSWPHYINPPEGHPGNGLWLIAPDQMADLVSKFHDAGLTVHCHCNGDEATEVFVDAVEAALERHPRWDHRHTVQHCQLTTPAQYKRMAKLGMQANIFSNHIYYWGDQHRDVTVGPDRAAGMDACATAEREGVRFSIHSDAPITPLGHLHTAWCAVNRVTASGQVLGPDERISVQTAMKAITIDAAFQLKLDHELGSIEAGKYADFAVLEQDPFEVDPMTLKDIKVWGTVLGGVPMPAS
jgi:predicted amidohydrolase YtcJ